MRTYRTILALGLFAVLAACGGGGDDDDDEMMTPPPPPPPPPEVTFEVTVQNLTNAQPLSPVLVTGHGEDFTFFNIGAPASAGLEVLAEGGDNADLMAEADGDDNVIVSGSGMGVIPPGMSEAVELTVVESDVDGLEISVVTMLVNTNDAITGVQALDVSGLEVQGSMMALGNVYDAGTELNTEAMGTIPGPADGGEGFNAARDDRADQVTGHPGVVTADDGLSTSILSGQHRFDNPAVSVTVTRLD